MFPRVLERSGCSSNPVTLTALNGTTPVTLSAGLSSFTVTGLASITVAAAARGAPAEAGLTVMVPAEPSGESGTVGRILQPYLERALSRPVILDFRPGAGGIGSRNIVPGSQQDLEASAGDRVLFAFDRSDITSEAQQILARQADWLQRYPNVTVTIEGHCDERGTREYNLALGERRAQAVKNVLVASGIPASRISTISYGKERPIVVGSNEEAWAQNRVAITTVN